MRVPIPDGSITDFTVVLKKAAFSSVFALTAAAIAANSAGDAIRRIVKVKPGDRTDWPLAVSVKGATLMVPVCVDSYVCTSSWFVTSRPSTSVRVALRVIPCFVRPGISGKTTVGRLSLSRISNEIENDRSIKKSVAL